MTRIGIEPQSPGPLANIVSINANIVLSLDLYHFFES